MKTRKIEKRPPMLTGETKADVQKLHDYLEYLRDELNYILTLIGKNMNGGENSGN